MSDDETQNGSGKPVVMVTGCSGKVGQAMVKHLSENLHEKFEIRAGTRDPDKCEKLRELSEVTVVQAEMGNTESLLKAFNGVNYLFLISPTVKKRTLVTLRTLDAAKDAGIKHIVFLSVFYAEMDDLVIGAQFKPLEAKLVCMGVDYTILRVMMFIDNHYRLREQILAQGRVTYPMDPDKPYTPVAIIDIARAYAAVLHNPKPYLFKTYSLASDRFTMKDLAKEFGLAIKKRIPYEQIEYDTALEEYLKLGYEPWQGEAQMELYHGIDEGAKWANISDIGDYKRITGLEPTTLKAWIEEIAPEFRPKTLKNQYQRGYRGYRGIRR